MSSCLLISLKLAHEPFLLVGFLIVTVSKEKVIDVV